MPPASPVEGNFWWPFAQHAEAWTTPLCFPRQVCDSYPTELYVPKSATAHIIVGSSKFRSRRRFPALSYYYKDNHVSLKACFCFGLCFSPFIINRPFSRGLLPVCGFEFLFKYVDVAMCAVRPNTTCVKALSPVNVDLPCLFDSKERRLRTHLDLIIWVSTSSSNQSPWKALCG